MGLRAHIYKSSFGSSSNGGISTDADEVTIMNIDGPDESSPDAPAVILVPGNLRNTAKIVEAMPAFFEGGRIEWHEAVYEGEVGPMFGGCVVDSPDTRFNEAVQALTGSYGGAVDLHDRYESQELYNRMFN